MNLKRIFLYLLITSVTLSALIGIGVILFGEFGELETKVLLTAMTVTVTSILGLACGAYLETKRGHLMPFVGIACAVVSAGMWMFTIWAWQNNNDTFVKFLLTATLLAIACSHLSLISLARLDRRFAWSRYAAHAAVWILSAILLYLIWFTPESNGDLIGRVIGTLAVIIAALTVVTPVFHKLSRVEGPTEIDTINIEIDQLRARIDELEQRKAEITPAAGE